ncbi:MAG: hypothetical protein A3G91_03485 [Omnitrophica WOR_2 bacterium RIFCSPLOWO2_12_FULL_50_9]|nr:MAG: hypothetical protein A3D87_07525 [Omnitrophica WOR_2 bacterium RIFCSPHIGHO2_02_FULL_50_17]OGX40642.1 MAG: hypothetical protein A3G91_03485 [Omnitrophica WOR_2 bacterium RIFCSPLOWO2_12_FULL_50_9]
MKALEEFKKHLKPGQVYRRSDLEQWSNAVDRHLKQLVEEETLQKLSQGLYYYPMKASFGNVPPEDEKLVSAFLKSDVFLLTTPNLYNSLGVGTTQLYNKRVVYNHKRHGQFMLGGKLFDFRLKHKFPRELSKEFLLVDLLNNLNELAEDRENVLKNVKEKFLEETESQMKRTVNAYAGERTKTLFNQWMSEESLAHA